MRVERSIDLPCRAEEAWAVLTDWERQADWMLDADAIEVRREPREGVGVRLDVRTRLFQMPAFTEHDGGGRVGAADGARDRARPADPRAWDLGARGPIDGGTRFTWTEEVELATSALGRIVAALLRAGARRADASSAARPPRFDHRPRAGAAASSAAARGRAARPTGSADALRSVRSVARRHRDRRPLTHPRAVLPDLGRHLAREHHDESVRRRHRSSARRPCASCRQITCENSCSVSCSTSVRAASSSK